MLRKPAENTRYQYNDRARSTPAFRRGTPSRTPYSDERSTTNSSTNYRVRLWISGAVNPIEQKETLVSFGQQRGARLAEHFFSALTSQMTKGVVDVPNDLRRAIHNSHGQACKIEDGVYARMAASVRHLPAPLKGSERAIRRSSKRGRRPTQPPTDTEHLAHTCLRGRQLLP
jgi:hypothetical protein